MGSNTSNVPTLMTITKGAEAFAAALDRAKDAVARFTGALLRHPCTPDPELVLRLAYLSKGLPAPPRLNGVRVMHKENRCRLGIEDLGSSHRRWVAGWRRTEPTRVRTCRGSRR